MRTPIMIFAHQTMYRSGRRSFSRFVSLIVTVISLWIRDVTSLPIHGAIPSADGYLSIEWKLNQGNDYQIFAGQSLEIKIPIKGNDVPTMFELRHNKQKVARYKNVAIQTRKDKTGAETIVTVTFEDTRPGDSGLYTLVMEDANGHQDVFNFYLMVTTAPLRLINGKKSTDILAINGSFTVNVKVGGSPLPNEFTIHRNGQQLSRLERQRFETRLIKLNHSVGIVHLSVKNITARFSGHYAVDIANEVGSSVVYAFNLVVPGDKQAMKANHDLSVYVLVLIALLWLFFASVVVMGIVSLVRNSVRPGIWDGFDDYDTEEGGKETAFGEFQLQLIDGVEVEENSEGTQDSRVVSESEQQEKDEQPPNKQAPKQ